MKNRSRKGETLVETLVAILIILLAATSAASITATANRMNTKAVERDTALYEALGALEDGSAEKQNGTVSITYHDTSIGSQFDNRKDNYLTPIYIQKIGEKEMFSYRKDGVS